MKNNKRKKKIILLTTLIILLIIVFIIQIAISVIEKHESEEQKMLASKTMGVYKDPQVEEQAEKTISYKNITVLSELKGNLPSSTVIKKVKKAFVEEIPTIIEKTKDMSDAELKQYYLNNEANLRIKVRIDNQDSFLNMINKFKNLTSNLEEDYKACEFLDSEGLKLKFSYENGEIVECSIIGANANTIYFEF